MRFELAGDWPVGSRTLPAASIITSGAHHGEIDMADVPKPLPLNARAIDEDGHSRCSIGTNPHSGTT